jgi:hypothetical protein
VSNCENPVDELTIRVYDWEDVEVILVNETLDFRAGCIVCEQIIGKILGGLKLKSALGENGLKFLDIPCR